MVALWCGASVLAASVALGGPVCRVVNQSHGGNDMGSGTLVDVQSDGSKGLVLSCAHLFRGGAGQIVVQFDDGRTHGARLVAIDHEADLAALAIANPHQQPVELAFDIQPGEQLSACGFGPRGVFQCAAGSVVGGATSDGQDSLVIAGAVRPGDSGGGVFDGRGRLVAVVWGERDGQTYASSGRPLRDFLRRVLGRQAACPGGVCPPVNRQPSQVENGQQVQPRLRQPAVDADSGLVKRVEQLESGLARIGQDLAKAVGQVEQGESEARTWRDSIADKLAGISGRKAGRAAGTLAVTALGISGPAGWGLVAASGVAGWLIKRQLGRRRRSEAGDERGENPSPPTSPQREEGGRAAGRFRQSKEIHQPVERDLDEARQLLQLSRSEGRDPLQDAIVGRLALDRLDTLAERDSQPDQARFADQLRRELRERFNDIAPTKF